VLLVTESFQKCLKSTSVSFISPGDEFQAVGLATEKALLPKLLQRAVCVVCQVLHVCVVYYVTDDTPPFTYPRHFRDPSLKPADEVPSPGVMSPTPMSRPAYHSSSARSLTAVQLSTGKGLSDPPMSIDILLDTEACLLLLVLRDSRSCSASRPSKNSKRTSEQDL